MSREAVILLHGLGRTKLSLFRLALALKKDYQVINLGYPSRKHPIETLANMAIAPALKLCEGAPKVHFVTHSMGGILVRHYLAHHQIENLGNTVMLGPPNKGSELVDFFLDQRFLAPIFRTINGPAGVQLGTHKQAMPNRLGQAEFNLGVIAGTEYNNPILAKLMPGEHDGKVSVESSKLGGMSDHIVMPVDHTFMMQRQLVIKQIQAFLASGRFNHHDA